MLVTAVLVPSPTPLRVPRFGVWHENIRHELGLSAKNPHLLAEVQRVSFVDYTGVRVGSPRLWNLQDLHAVLP